MWSFVCLFENNCRLIVDLHQQLMINIKLRSVIFKVAAIYQPVSCYGEVTRNSRWDHPYHWLRNTIGNISAVATSSKQKIASVTYQLLNGVCKTVFKINIVTV